MDRSLHPGRRRAARGAWALSAAAAFLAACAPVPPPAVPGPTAPLVPAVVRVGHADGSGAVRSLPLEQYVLATVLSETVPPSGDRAAAERIFEVQAIVARTYAAANLGRHASQGFDLCDSTHCQVLDLSRLERSPWVAVARRAVERTAGQVLLYGGRPIQALFHADCGARTSGADEVWGGTPVPYLTGHPDRLPGNDSHMVWRYEIAGQRLSEALGRNGGPQVGSAATRVEVTARDSAGRAQQVVVSGRRTVTLRGENFRSAVNAVAGPLAIRSTWFTVSRADGRFVFEGRGFGHGVGLCQTGAAARARAGESPRDILAFYYPGTVIRGGGARGRRAADPIPIPKLRPRGGGPAGPV